MGSFAASRWNFCRASLAWNCFRLEKWREWAIDASLKARKADPAKAERDTAIKWIGDLTMQMEQPVYTIYQRALTMTHRDRTGDRLDPWAGQGAGQEGSRGSCGASSRFPVAPLRPLRVRRRARAPVFSSWDRQEY